MKPFSKIDMGEVTRLTLAGKLAEATALLQGRLRGGVEVDSPGPTPDHSTTLDMTPPRFVGGAWTAPASPPPADEPPQAKPAPLVRTLLSLRDRLPRTGALSGLGKGLNAQRPAAPPLPKGARFEERAFSNDAGTRAYKVYVPSGYIGQPLPVVVMLHGCTQNPDDFAAGTRMNEIAEEQTFVVAYPQQPRSANMQMCWNWFKPEDQQRGAGEPSLIAGVARQVVEEFSADPSRVYVAGLSAGGAAAAIMASTYPDVFAAVGVHSGLACGAARDMPSAFAAMAGNGAVPAAGGRPVPTIVFHGDADKTVNPVNGDHVAAQAKGGRALSSKVTEGESRDGLRFTRTVYADATGAALLEQWALHGAGHAWSGGSASGSYTDPRGPDASREMIRFFLGHAQGRR